MQTPFGVLWDCIVCLPTLSFSFSMESESWSFYPSSMGRSET